VSVWTQAAEAIALREKLEFELAMSRKLNEQQKAQIVELKLLSARLEDRIRDLGMRVGSDSSNSGKPPSSDPPWDKESKRFAP